jgi:hypothetical protein
VELEGRRVFTAEEVPSARREGFTEGAERTKRVCRDVFNADF